MVPDDGGTAESGKDGTASSGIGPFRYVDLSPGLRLWGLDLEVEAGLDSGLGLDAGLWLYGGAAWENVCYFDDGTGLSTATAGSGLDPTSFKYDRMDVKGGAGIFMGLHRAPGAERDDTRVLAAWMYQADLIWPDLPAGSWLLGAPGQIDNAGMLDWFLLDLLHDAAKRDEVSRMTTGYLLEAWGEWAPGALQPEGSSPWLRGGAMARGMLPLFRTTRTVEEGDATEEWNQFSGTLCGQILVDAILPDDASTLPHQIYNVVGGVNYRYGMGGLVRGLADGYKSGLHKASASLEFRCNGPAILHKDLVPILVAYGDAGVSDGLDGTVTWSAGSGFGLFLDILGLAELGAYTQWNFPEPNENGEFWTPVAIAFGLHF